MIYFDVDNTLRDLNGAAGILPKKYECKIKGIPFVKYFDKNIELVRYARPTKYHEAAYMWHKYIGNIMLLSSSKWKEETIFWVGDNFCPPQPKILFVEQKLSRLKSNDILVEDNPSYSNDDRVIIVDQSYNRNTVTKRRVINSVELFKELLWRTHGI